MCLSKKSFCGGINVEMHDKSEVIQAEMQVGESFKSLFATLMFSCFALGN